MIGMSAISNFANRCISLVVVSSSLLVCRGRVIDLDILEILKVFNLLFTVSVVEVVMNGVLERLILRLVVMML
jgi:hypothetical protein